VALVCRPPGAGPAVGIFDGLVGQAFLRPFAVTFDVAAAEMVLGRAE
jgi:hypothetical protein